MSRTPSVLRRVLSPLNGQQTSMHNARNQRGTSMLLPLVALACCTVLPALATAVPRGQSSARATTPDIQTVTDRRLATIVGGTTGATSISTWYASQRAFLIPQCRLMSAAGCLHLSRTASGLMSTTPLAVMHPPLTGRPRLTGRASVGNPYLPFFQLTYGPHICTSVTFSSAWHGGLKNAAQFVQSTQVRSAISSAMGFWFSNDFANPSCLDSGGDAACPCGTPGLWNTNWFSNVRRRNAVVGFREQHSHSLR